MCEERGMFSNSAGVVVDDDNDNDDEEEEDDEECRVGRRVGARRTACSGILLGSKGTRPVYVNHREYIIVSK
jgi:hypothetical protein